MVIALLLFCVNNTIPRIILNIVENIKSLFKHNFHTHTHYCDGSAAPEEYIKSAIAAGLHSIGFSSHAPVPMENNFAIRDEDALAAYCREIRQLHESHEEINVYLGLEADYIPGTSLDFDYFRTTYDFDYIIGSVHLVKNADNQLWFIDGPKRETWKDGLMGDFDGDITRAVSAYYHQVSEMLTSQKPDVLGHFDKVKMHNRGDYFSEDAHWYRALISDTLKVIAESDCVVEVNTRGLYKKRSEALFPDLDILKQMHKMQIPVTISTDAHQPSEIGLLIDVACNTIKKAGYKEVYFFDKKEWKGMFLD